MQLEKPLEALRLEDLLFSPVKYIAVVAIDFGTTYSGFAFAFNHKEGEAGIHMNKEWGSDQGCRTLKTPTCLLLKPDTSFDSFGYEAAERFAYFDDEEAKEYYFFERFKMFLHNSQDFNRNTMLEEKNGKSLKALDVFAHSICYLKDVALDIIRERTGDEEFSAVDVQWVLTVPAIWKPAAKQFMREAAYKAGLASADAPEQLLIALEPEAASIYCREKKIREFVTESERDNATVSDVLARPNIQYMVIDIGGGTLDVTAHELLTNGALKEIYRVTGGPWGGTKVDEEFHHFLEQIFGERLIYSYQQSYPADWLCLRNDFEMKKRGKRAFQGASTRIRLPRSFYNTLSSQFGSDLDSVVSRSYCPAEVKLYGGEYLCLSPNIMKRLFEPVLSGIVNHLHTLLKNEELSGVKLFFLVGGFADSLLLQSAIKKEFESCYRVLIPQCSSIAVVQGAVMFGQTPDTFESRIMSFTYGIKVSRLFLDGLHPVEKKVYVEGVPRCRDVFFTFVKAGEAVKVGQKKRISGFSPLCANQKEVKIDFYSSESRDVMFVTDEGVNMLPGGLVFEVTDEWKPQDIEINLHFGETEMKVTIVDTNSGFSKTTYLDFLSKNL